MYDLKLLKTIMIAFVACLLLSSVGFSNEKRTITKKSVLPKAQMKKLIVSSDHILQGAITDVKRETHRLKRIYSAKLKITDCFSTTLKVGDAITVTWESHPLKQISHQHAIGVEGIWFLRKEGNVYSANQVKRFLPLAYFEQVFTELDQMGTRVYINNPKVFLADEKKIQLIIRNIEADDLKMPTVKQEGKNLVFHPDFSFRVVPISSFSQNRTILSKKDLKTSVGAIIKKAIKSSELIVTNKEVRIEFDLNQLYQIPKKGYYAVIFDRKGYPGETIAAIEVKKRLKLKDKYDFRLMANNKFASDSIKHTVAVLKSIVKEQDTQKAFLKLRKITTLHLEGKNIVNLLPLASFAQIEYLELADNKIEDLTPLKKLKKLRYLSVDNNELKNLKGLEFQFELEFVSANDNSINDLSALANLKKMYYFSASNNLIKNLSVFKKLIRVQILTLSSNIITDIRPLSQVLALRRLDLKNNSVRELDALVYANNLEYLNLIGNAIVYIENLEPLTKVHSNDFGRGVKLKILKDKSKKEIITEVDTKSGLLPKMEEAHKVKKVVVTEKSKETFQQKVAKLGVKVDVKISATGKVINVSDENKKLIIQYSKEVGVPAVGDKVTIFRDKDYIGTSKIVAVKGNKVVGEIIAELNNERKLQFKINDSARFQED